MLKELDISKIDNVMKIWLEVNIRAHDFIKEDYWMANYDYVKNALPEATVYVYEDNNEIKGFIGIIEEYIAGLFVSNQYQNEGIGSRLLEQCKKVYSVLRLDVYAKNLKAINFYKKNGFKIEKEKVNDDTKEVEYSMVWEP